MWGWVCDCVCIQAVCMGERRANFQDYTVKKVSGFPIPPAGMPLTKLSLAGNNLIIPPWPGII
jgi:hypothetical protein